jgi:MoaA/NifB/PqqE/SkfB family radical SAM enzyme
MPESAPLSTLDEHPKQSASHGIVYDVATNEVLNRMAGDGVLSSVIWHITDRCPLSCPYCFSTKTRAEVAPEEVEPIATALADLATLKVDISGGEPLISPVLPLVFSALERRSIHMTITTSGRASDRARQWLIDRSAAFARVIVSIDGGSTLHDALRGHPETHAGAVRLARDAVSHGARVRINTVVTRPLVQHPTGLADLAEAVRLTDVQEWLLIQPHPANEKPEFRQNAISTSCFQDFVSDAECRIQGMWRDRPIPVRLMVRTASRYSKYWILYPDGVLRRHTSGSADTAGIPLTPHNLPQVQSHIKAIEARSDQP